METTETKYDPMVGPMSTLQFAAEIEREFYRSQSHGYQFNSLHEACAVILEEYEELWEHARKKKSDRNLDEIQEELIQIAAMCYKAQISMAAFVSTRGGVRR